MKTYCFDVVYKTDWGHFKVETEMPDEVLDTLQYLASETIRRNGYTLSQWGESLKNKVLKNCDAELNGYEFDVGVVKDFICDEDDDSVWFREYPDVHQSDFDVRYPPYNQDDYKYFDTYEEVEEIIKKLDKEGRPYELDTNRGWGIIVKRKENN